MATRPYMPLMMGDWIQGTRGMKAEMRGVYLSLLLYQFDNGFIPSDIEELRLIEPEVDKVWVKLKHKFKEIAPDKLQNLKCERVREFWNKQSKNGKKGGRKPRVEPKPNPKHIPNDNPNHNLHNDLDNDLDLLDKNGEETSIPCEMLKVWVEAKPSYTVRKEKDLPALFGISIFIKNKVKETKTDPHFEIVTDQEIMDNWIACVAKIQQDNFYANKQLSTIDNQIQTIWDNAIRNGTEKPDSYQSKLLKGYRTAAGNSEHKH